MSDDWRPGDKAICIRDGRNTRKGQVFTVALVFPRERFCDFGGIPAHTADALVFHEVKHPSNPNGRYSAYRFRKIRPHTPDAEDAEVIALLNGAGVKEASDA